MDNTTDPKRDRPAEKGRGNDPNLRDEDARQQNLNTISSNDNDNTDQHLTRTTSDSYRDDKPGDKKADKRFDE